MGLQLLFAFSSLMAAPALDIASTKQLLIDTFFFAESQNVELRVHPAAKTSERTIQPDKPWEDATLGWFSVLEDNGRCRMWYECYDVAGWPTADDTSFCYAESEDGVTWRKPEFDFFAYPGSPKSNILFRQVGPEGAHSRVHGCGVFLDGSAPPEARYKAVSQGRFLNSTPVAGDPPASGPEGFYRVAGMYSADGLVWSRYPEPICTIMADSQYSAFWEGSLNQYVLYGRTSGHGRALGRSSSPKFTHFAPLELVLETDSQTLPNCDLYNPAALKYPYAENAYFLFPSLYNHDTGKLDIRIATSRDGIHWTWPQFEMPFIALGQDGDFDSGSLYMGQGLIRREEEIWQFFSGSPLRHDEAELPNLTKAGNERIFSRVTSRLDGFVSADAGAAGGYFLSPPFIFTGSGLYLNAQVREGGSIRVGLLNESGDAERGRDTRDCIPLTGDHTDLGVAWQDGAEVSSLAGKTVRMRVEMVDASLFAFQFR